MLVVVASSKAVVSSIAAVLQAVANKPNRMIARIKNIDLKCFMIIFLSLVGNGRGLIFNKKHTVIPIPAMLSGIIIENLDLRRISEEIDVANFNSLDR